MRTAGWGVALVAIGALLWWSVDRRPPLPVPVEREAGAQPANPELSSSPTGAERHAPPGQLREDPAATGGAVRVRVVTRDGRPVAAATVETFADTTPATRLTATDGTCALPVAPGEGTLRLGVSAPELWPASGQYPRKATIDVTLVPRTVLAGTVRDAATLAPVAGATVDVPDPASRGTSLGQRTTGPDGTFTLPVPVGLALHVHVQGAEHPSQFFRFQLAEPHPVAREFRLRRGVRVHGRVLAHESGAPVDDAMVRDERTRLARTAADGGFSVLALPKGDGSVALRYTAVNRCRVHLTLTADEAAREVVVRLPRAVPIAGTVRDPDGRPVAGAKVEVHPVGSTPPDVGLPAAWQVAAEDGMPGGTSDDEGRFETSGVVPRLTYQVVVHHPDHGYGTPRTVVVADDAPLPVDLLRAAAAAARPPHAPRLCAVGSVATARRAPSSAAPSLNVGRRAMAASPTGTAPAQGRRAKARVFSLRRDSA